MKKFEEAFNNMTRALFTLDAVQVVDWEGRGTFSGHQAIEKWFAVKFALNPGEFGGKLVGLTPWFIFVRAFQVINLGGLP